MTAFLMFILGANAFAAPSEEDPNRFTGVKEWTGGIQTDMYWHQRISGGDCGTNEQGQKVGHPVYDIVVRTSAGYDVHLPKDEKQKEGFLQWGGDKDSGSNLGSAHFSWNETENESGCPFQKSWGQSHGFETTSNLDVWLSMLILDDEKNYTLIPAPQNVKGEKRIVTRSLEEDGKGHKKWVTHVETIDKEGIYAYDGEKTSPFPVPYYMPVGGPPSHNFGTLDFKNFDNDESTMKVLTDPNLKDKVSVPLPKHGMRLVGQAIDTDRKVEKQGEKTILNEWRMVTRWQLAPKGKADFDVIIKIDGLDSWIPEGNKDQDRPGNTISIRAELRDKQGKKADLKPEKWILELINTSREPGVCMNHPQYDKADDKFDMRFEQEKNTAFAVEDEKGQKMETAEQDKTAVLSSFDYGGWTKVSVTAVLPGGTQIYGHLEGASATMIPVPKRADDSKIASAWKKDAGDDASDEDAEPEGDGHKGDGLTLYEEYRGFYSTELGKHIRTNPKKKNYFFVNKVGTAAKSGTGLFKRISGIDSIEMSEEDLCSEAGRENVINFNHAEAPHAVDQHGVILTWDFRGESSSEAISKKSVPGTPGTIMRIAIGQTFDPDAIKVLTRGGKKMSRATFQRTIAHEMLHSCSVWHHGDRDRRGVWWIVEGTAPDDYISEKRIGGTEIPFGPLRLFNESGASIDEEMKQFIKDKGPMKLYVGNQRGQHSGVEDCVMRYHVADAYDPAEGGSFVRVWVGHQDELPGLGLCDRREGTGVNAPGYGPFGPRYGNADYDSKRGRCKYQICVNDAYADAHTDRSSDE